MAAIDYLRAHDLHADPLPGGRIYVWPADNITPEVRVWIKAHKSELLQELSPTNSEDGLSRLDWLEWIASEVRLVPEDHTYVWSRLATLPPDGAEAAARRYVDLWRRAAESEPKSHCKENAGRKAANLSLLYLVRPGSPRWESDHRR